MGRCPGQWKELTVKPDQEAPGEVGNHECTVVTTDFPQQGSSSVDKVNLIIDPYWGSARKIR